MLDSLTLGETTNVVLSRFFVRVLGAIQGRDLKFFPDFGQAFKMMHASRASNRRLLIADSRRHEFMVLVAILEDPAPIYSVSGLRRKIAKRFTSEVLTDKAVNKVMGRLGIAKPRRGK